MDVHGRASRDLVQPCTELAARVESGSVPPRLDEGLLDCFFGQPAVCKSTHRDGQHRSGEPRVDIAHHIWVAGSEALRQLAVRMRASRQRPPLGDVVGLVRRVPGADH
jgi:hypothetical protein